MPKFRTLTAQELEPLEKEFIDFLVVNGIVAADWETMKSEAPNKANRMIELFSDVVFEGIFRKVNFLDFESPNRLMAFQCLDEKMVLVAMEATNGQDLTSPAFHAQALAGKADGLKVYTTEKAYSKERELELFEMTQQGCTISKSGELFKSLCLAL